MQINLLPSQQKTVYGIDASAAPMAECTGVERYAYCLIQALKQQRLRPDEEVRLYSPTPLSGGLEVLPSRWSSCVLRWPLRQGWMQGRVGWEMLRRPPNVLFVPSQEIPPFSPNQPSRRRLTVTTIRDLGFRRRPELFESSQRRHLEQATAFAIRHASFYFVPSAWIKAELIDLYSVSEERIHLVPEAGDEMNFQSTNSEHTEEVLRRYRLGRKNFFLFLGCVVGEEKPVVLIRAFEKVKQGRGIGDTFTLVYAGSPGFKFEEVKAAAEHSIARDAIRFLGWIPEEDRSALVASAFALVSPRWYEGFGLSVLEGMAAGVPVVASHIPPHEEVAGEAAILVPPGDAQAWALAWKRLLMDGVLMRACSQHGSERARLFSWNRAAEAVLGALRKRVGLL